MSNRTTFQLQFSCATREQLEHVLWYINFKKSRWDYWRECDGKSEALLTRVGVKLKSAVVAEGYSLKGEIEVSPSGRASVEATASVNQNSRNVWISGDLGELNDLRQRFSFLKITGTYQDEFGRKGDV